MTVIVPDQPDMVGALGAALHGERSRRKTASRALACICPGRKPRPDRSVMSTSGLLKNEKYLSSNTTI